MSATQSVAVVTIFWNLLIYIYIYIYKYIYIYIYIFSEMKRDY